VPGKVGEQGKEAVAVLARQAAMVAIQLYRVLLRAKVWEVEVQKVAVIMQ